MLAAPSARKPEAIQGLWVSEVEDSPPITITRSQRPVRIQSSATPMAWVVDAQAPLMSMLGPLALISWAK